MKFWTRTWFELLVEERVDETEPDGEKKSGEIADADLNLNTNAKSPASQNKQNDCNSY